MATIGSGQFHSNPKERQCQGIFKLLYNCAHFLFCFQSLSHVQLFATSWTAACQASLSFTISWSLLKLMSIELMMPSNHHPLSPPSSYASKVMLKILQATLQQYVNWQNFQMFSLSLEKAEEPEIKLLIFVGSWTRQGSSRKISTSASWTTLKPLTMCITTNCGKFFKRWVYQTTLPVPWETCMQVKKQQLELDMEQLTGSKLEKEYNKAVCCNPVYLTYMQSISCEMPGWMKHKLESRFPGEISTTSDRQMIRL